MSEQDDGYEASSHPAGMSSRYRISYFRTLEPPEGLSLYIDHDPVCLPRKTPMV